MIKRGKTAITPGKCWRRCEKDCSISSCRIHLNRFYYASKNGMFVLNVPSSSSSFASSDSASGVRRIRQESLTRPGGDLVWVCGGQRMRFFRNGWWGLLAGGDGGTPYIMWGQWMILVGSLWPSVAHNLWVTSLIGLLKHFAQPRNSHIFSHALTRCPIIFFPGRFTTVHPQSQ